MTDGSSTLWGNHQVSLTISEIPLVRPAPFFQQSDILPLTARCLSPLPHSGCEKVRKLLVTFGISLSIDIHLVLLFGSKNEYL